MQMAREALGDRACGVWHANVCVCDCAQVCLWLCVPSWSEVNENENHKSHTAVHGVSLEFESEDYG